jgi:membrane fusion protein, multidrug efflux system
MSENKEQTVAKDAKTDKKIRKGPKLMGTIILVVVAVVGASFAIVWGIDSVAYVGTDDAAIDGRQVKLSSKIPARIGEVKAAEGEKVKVGQVLVVLEDRDLRAQEAQALASLGYAKENLNLANVNLDKARGDFERMKILHDAGATSKENYDHAQKALETAQAQVNLAGASVATATAQLGVIEAQLPNVLIATPIDGTVEKITLNAGDLAQAGQTILSVNNLESVWVTANLEETKIGKIVVGAPVRINVDAYPGRVFLGEVEMIRSGIVPPAFQIGEFTKTTQRVPVKIRFEAPLEGTTLLPGMSVEVKIRTTAKLPPLVEGLHL